MTEPRDDAPAGAAPAGDTASSPAPSAPEAADGGHRPFIERLGLAFIALVLALMFGGVAVAAWVGGAAFLAIMAAIGALMTAWAGANTLFRG